MRPKEITDQLAAISKSVSGLIGRLTLLRTQPLGKESHELAISIGNRLDDLINEIDGETEK